MAKKHSISRKARQPSKSRNNLGGRTAKALLDANQRLQSILIANEVATWTWDIVNDRVIADENLARLFGVSRQDAVGGPI